MAASADIGPAGGRVDAPDYSLSVIVPPGAFDRVRTVALQPISNQAHGARGGAWRITPEGLNTPVPMTLEFRYTAAQGQGAARLKLATQGADGIWRASRATEHDAAERVLRVQTRHFSDWSFVAGAQLRPGHAEVGVGQALELSLVDCGSANDAAEPAAQQLYACQHHGGAALGNSDWRVNGVAGGAAATGTLSGSDTLQASRRTYTAPATLPVANPVAVSVNYRFLGDGPPETLVAHVKVIDPQAGCAWLAGVTRMAGEIDSDYRWAGRDETEAQTLFSQTRSSGMLRRMEPSPVGSAWFQGQMNAGTVRVEAQSRMHIGTDITDVSAQAAPFQMPPTHPQVFVMVNLQTCQVKILGGVPVMARPVRTQQGGSFEQPVTSVGGGFVLGTEPIAGRREFVGEAVLPANSQGPSTDTSFYRPDVGFNLIAGPVGTARVRWAFRPQ